MTPKVRPWNRDNGGPLAAIDRPVSGNTPEQKHRFAALDLGYWIERRREASPTAGVARQHT